MVKSKTDVRGVYLTYFMILFMRYRLHKVVFYRAIIGHLFLTSVCLSFFDPTADNDIFHCKYCKGFHTASRKGVSRVRNCLNHLFSQRRTIANCLFAKPTTIKFQTFCVFLFWGWGGGGSVYSCASGDG